MENRHYSALEVANWFLAFSQLEAYPIENIKLQKLLYFAQAHHLANYEIALFDEEIEAWENGPVVSEVNKEMNLSDPSGEKSMNDFVYLTSSFDFASFDPETTDFLMTVWNTYAHMHRVHLSRKTHKEVPWKWYLDETSDRPSKIIPKEVIKNYYMIRELVAQ